MSLEPGAPPQGDFIFTSTDSSGTPGVLNRYVIESLGLGDLKLPSADQLRDGYRSLPLGNGRVLVVVVTVDSNETSAALRTNLTAALNSLGPEAKNRVLWLPLMGTGVGQLTYRQSLSTTLGCVKQCAAVADAAEVIIAPPAGTSDRELRELQEEVSKTFPLRYSPSVAALGSSMSSPVTAADVVKRLVSEHPDYVSNLPTDLSPPAGTSTKPVEGWLTDVLALYRGLQNFHGRLVIVGLSILDEEVGRVLSRLGLLQEIAFDLHPPLERLLTEAALRRWRALLHEPDTVATLTDQPADVDQLSRQAFCDSLALRLRGNRRDEQRSHRYGPFMLHLYGAWGSGKSTVLKMLASGLRKGDPSDRWVVIDFNAWQHERLGAPWWWLIEAVARQSLGQVTLWRRIWIWSAEARWRWWNLYGGRYHLVLGVMLIAIWAGLEWCGASLHQWLRSVVVDEKSSESIRRLGELFKTLSAVGGVVTLVWPVLKPVFLGPRSAPALVLSSQRDPHELLINRFTALIDRCGRSVAVFVDDLDRCRGEYVVALLEGIQTLFKTAPVAYVIAADRRWLKASFEKAYEAYAPTVSEPGRPLGYLFLDKLFEASIALPRLAPEVQRSYWLRLLRMDETTPGSEVDAAHRRASEQLARLESEEEILAVVERKRDDVVYDRALREEAVRKLATPAVEQRTRHFLQGFASLVERNPRAMKRLVNAYGIVRSVALLSENAIDRAQLARWVILNLRWPALGEFLESHPEAIEMSGSAGTYGGDDPMRHLLLSPDVAAVIRGGDVGRDLDREAVARCAALG